MLAAIAIGGALGAPARYGIAQLLPFTPGTFPWGTFWTNLSGAFVLGFFLAYLIERFPPTRFVRAFFGIGFLGAYTTFSTFTAETVGLVARGEPGMAMAYVLASVAVGLGAAVGGLALGRAL